MKMTTNVAMLSGMELDCWVERALGHEIVGKALAYYDPESGYPSVEPSQIPRTGCLATHERYFYIRECGCELCEQLFLEMKESIPEMTRENKVLGHDWRCLIPVVDYSTDSAYIGDIIKEGNLSVAPKDDNWTATAGNYTMQGTTLSEAVMRAFVASKFGDMIET